MNLADLVVVVISAVLLGGLGWFFFGRRQAQVAEMPGLP